MKLVSFYLALLGCLIKKGMHFLQAVWPVCGGVWQGAHC